MLALRLPRLKKLSKPNGKTKSYLHGMTGRQTRKKGEAKRKASRHSRLRKVRPRKVMKNRKPGMKLLMIGVPPEIQTLRSKEAKPA